MWLKFDTYIKWLRIKLSFILTKKKNMFGPWFEPSTFDSNTKMSISHRAHESSLPDIHQKAQNLILYHLVLVSTKPDHRNFCPKTEKKVEKVTRLRVEHNFIIIFEISVVNYIIWVTDNINGLQFQKLVRSHRINPSDSL